MVRLKFRTARLLAEMVCVVALVAACASTTATPQPSTEQIITGAASCPPAESQNLTFSGAVMGHLSCSTAPAKCSTTDGTPSLAVPLNARIGSTPVQLVVVFNFWVQRMKHDQPGTYPAGKLRDAQDSSPYGATLDGDGHWETPTPGGSMTLATDDAAGASGTLDIKLTLGDKTFAVAGTWHCVRP
jgi:hypothetical protein